MDYLPQLLTIAGVHLLAVISPGPDFVMITKNSLLHSRRNGIYSSIGLGLGILTHVAYCMAGIGLLISQSIVLFNAIKLIGAAYLIYIGVKALLSKDKPSSINDDKQRELTDWQAFRMGYITNVTNPKATLFVLSLFTLVISATTPLVVKVAIGLEMAIVTALWFSLVSVILSHNVVKGRFSSVQHRLEQVMGAVLVALGLKVAFAHSK